MMNLLAASVPVRVKKVQLAPYRHEHITGIGIGDRTGWLTERHVTVKDVIKRSWKAERQEAARRHEK